MQEPATGADHAKDNPTQRGKDRVYQIAIMCPNANFPAPVGMSSTKSSYEFTRYQGNTFSCPVCGQMHTWDKSASFLVVSRGSYVGEHFENDVIILDASSFDNCVIRNCDMHLSRGNFRLTNCEITDTRFNFAGEAAVVKSISDSLMG